MHPFVPGEPGQALRARLGGGGHGVHFAPASPSSHMLRSSPTAPSRPRLVAPRRRARLCGNQQGRPYLARLLDGPVSSRRDVSMPLRLAGPLLQDVLFSMWMASISVQACKGELRLRGRWSHVNKLRAPKRTSESPKLPKSPSSSVTLALLYMQQQKVAREIKYGLKGPSNTCLSLEPQP